MPQENSRDIFCQNLLYYMDARGMSQVELADKLNVPRSTVCTWCKGKSYPRIDKIEQMAALFGVPLRNLMEDHLSEETEAQNDALADLVLRLRREDGFYKLVMMLSKLTAEQLNAVAVMVSALTQQP